MGKKTIINKHNYKAYLADGKLLIGSNKKVKLEEMDNLNIVARDCNNIKVGNNCTIECDDCNKINVLDNGHIKTKENCTIYADNGNFIETETECYIYVNNKNKVKTGKSCKVEFGNENKIKCGEFCKIQGCADNSVEIESSCYVSLWDNCHVNATGKNIKLEFKENEGENSFFNDMEDSVILTYNLLNRMKIYNSNDLRSKEFILCKNGIIERNY